jgi:hypothetical protein
VTDRAGRTGVAVTADDQQHHIQMVLVFDARTGDLLAQEYVTLKPQREVSSYSLFLAYDRTNQRG